MIKIELIPCLLLFLCGLFSCNQGTNKVKDKVMKYMEGKDSAEFRMSQFTPFDWDKMFAFGYDVPREKIQDIIGCKYEDYEPYADKIIFVNDGQVIYKEIEEINIEQPNSGQLIFDRPYGKQYFMCSHDNDDFSIVRMNIYDERGSCYFLLRWIGQ